MTGSFHISLFEGTLHVDKIHVRFKITNITQALPVPVYRPISHRNVRSFRVYMKPLWDFVPEWNSRPGKTTGVNSRRDDSCRHDILWWYHLNKCRAMRGNRSELTPARKSPRCHVMSCKQPLTCEAPLARAPPDNFFRIFETWLSFFLFLFTFLYLLLMMEVVCWLYQTMAFVRMSSGCFLEPSSFLLVFYCTYRAMRWLSLDLICYHGNETCGTCVYQLKDLGQHMRSPWNKHNKSLESFVLNSPDHHFTFCKTAGK